MSLQQRTSSSRTRRLSATRYSASTIIVWTAVVGLIVLTIIGPYVTPYDPESIAGPPGRAPGSTYWFGTDSSGLDVFSRTVAATRNNVIIGIAAALVATFVGVLVGLFIGMNESSRGLIGVVARLGARVIDLLQAIPAMVIGLSLVAIFGSTVTVLIVTLGLVLFPNQARLVRTEVLSVRAERYLDAARIAGFGELRLTFVHVLPNSLWPALENMIILFGAATFTTAALGFLGVGLRPPTPEWGSMISVGAPDAAVGRWWPAFFPGLAISISVLVVTGFGRRVFERPHRNR